MTKTNEQPWKGIEVPLGMLIPEIVDDLTRREFLIGAGLIVIAPSCGSDEEGSNGGEEASGERRTIEHRYGTTEIPKSPERIVEVGFTGPDYPLALGVAPVGVREFYGNYSYGTWPWAQDELGDAKPEVLPSTELNFEQIAGLRPDLILGVSSGMTEDDYETLSRIAPTVDQSDEYVEYGVPWQEQTRVTGRALGREELAESVISRVEGRFANEREAHPEFDGKTIAVAAFPGEGTFNAYGPDDVRARFFTALGFKLPGRIVELTGDKFFATLSKERLDLLDHDVLVLFGPERDKRETVMNEPLYQRLEAVREGRVIYLDLNDVLNGALSFGSPLSLPFALEEAVPQLAAAIDGDPETETTE